MGLLGRVPTPRGNCELPDDGTGCETTPRCRRTEHTILRWIRILANGSLTRWTVGCLRCRKQREYEARGSGCLVSIGRSTREDRRRHLDHRDAYSRMQKPDGWEGRKLAADV